MAGNTLTIGNVEITSLSDGILEFDLAKASLFVVGIGQGFEPGRNIDAVTVNIITFNQHFAEIDADTELDALIFRSFRFPRNHCMLNINRRSQSIDNTRVFNQKCVAHCLDDTTIILAQCGIDELRANGAHALAGAERVTFHKAAVTDHVGDDDDS